MTESIAPLTARVVFRKQVSDGNYGSEVAEVSFDVDADDAYEASEAVIALALENARKLVHDELSRSPSANVRRALERPKPVSDEAWAAAERSAEYELAAGKRDNARDDDDPEDLPY